MIKLAFNPYLPEWDIYPMENRAYLAIASIFTAVMTRTEEMNSACWIMYAGARRWTTWETGAMRG